LNVLYPVVLNVVSRAPAAVRIMTMPSTLLVVGVALPVMSRRSSGSATMFRPRSSREARSFSKTPPTA